MKTNQIFITLFLYLFVAANVWAQDKNISKNQRKLDKALTGKDYENALPPVRYLLRHEKPISWTTLQAANRVYVYWAEDASDALRAMAMKDTVLQIFEQMAITYPDSAIWSLNQKGLKAATYWQDAPEKRYIFYSHLLDVAGNKILPINNLHLLESLCEATESKRIRKDSALTQYERIHKILADQNKANRKNRQLDSLRRVMYQLSQKCLKKDCAYVFEFLKPIYEKHPDSLTLAKQIMVLMQQHGCTTDPLYEKTALHVQQYQPSTNLLIRLGRDAKKNQQYAKSREYFYKAIAAKPNCEVQAECYLQIASTYSAEKQYVLAKKYAFMAWSMSEQSEQKVYRFLAELYATAAPECARTTSTFQEKLIYLIAYYYYGRAGERNEQAILKPKLPTKDDLQKAGFKEGDIAATGCWINEKVVLKVY